MPDYTKYPTAADVFAVFVAAKILPKAGCDCASLEDDGVVNFTSAIDAAVDQWENATGYHPFLAGEATTRQFRSDGGNDGVFDLKGGVVPSSVTAVSIGNLSQNGTPQTLTANEQYVFYPYDSESRKKPATQIEMRSHSCWGGWGYSSLWGVSRYGVLSVTGRFGYCATLPSDVWEAIRKDAACIVAPEVSQAISLGLITWTEDGVTERYSEDRIGVAVKGWSAFRDRVLNSGTYKRLAMA